jgi:8-oxo-dGTP diphosphatase
MPLTYAPRMTSTLTSPTDWPTWTPDLRTTLIFVVRDAQVLLIEKKTGIGRGKINGPGGKIEADESPADCARRELQEELKVIATEPQLVARLFFSDVEDLNILVYVFLTDQMIGDPVETKEAKPLWSSPDNLPLDDMWEDDQYWLPQVLNGESIDGYFHFRNERLLEFTVQPLGTGNPPHL